MSQPKAPDPAKLVISLLMNDKTILNEVLPILEEALGEIALQSPWFDFDYTNYYHKEMGSPLYRRVVAFERLIEQDRLAHIKQMTNDIEKRWEVDGRRSLNIDPGYLLLSRFILATGKDYSHRIYIGEGIYADLTLMYTKGKFLPLEWSYPDYASSEIQQFLEAVREIYFPELKAWKKCKETVKNKDAIE